MPRLSLVFKKYFFGVILLLLVFIPLYPKFPLFNIPGTYVAVRAEDFLIAAAIFLWLIGHLFKLKGYVSETVYQAFVLFWLIGGLSLLSAILVTYFVTPHLGFLHWFRRVEYMSLFIIAATSVSSIKQAKWSVGVLFVTALAVIVYGFGQIWLEFPVISTTNKEFSKGLVLALTNGARVNSTFAGHYDLAVYLSLVLVIAASLFFYYKKIIVRVPVMVTAISSFILLGFTAARVSFVATLLGIALVFWLNKKRLLLVGLVIATLAILAAVPDLRHRMVETVTVNLMGGGGPKYTPPPGTVTKFTPKQKQADGINSPVSTSSAAETGAIAVDTVPGEPINTTELGVYRSFGIRFNVEWPRALNAFYKNPLLGTGYSSLTIATDNGYLRSLGETGLLGTLSLGLIFFIIIKKMLRFLKGSSGFPRFFIVGLLCSIIVFLVTATFIDVLEASKVAEIFWLILGLGWGMMRVYDHEKSGNA